MIKAHLNLTGRIITKGEIYKVNCVYEDDDSISEERPVVIVRADNTAGLYVVVQITSEPPKEPPSTYDQYKLPIFNWRQAGLVKPSYAKLNRIERFTKDELLEYYGRMNRMDLTRIEEAINQLY